MSIRLEINGDSVVEYEDDTITLGSDESCTVSFPPAEDLAPKHAVIRKIAGRWLVEVRDAAFIQVSDEPPSRMHWLNRGDVIRLTENGPEITFEPDRAATRKVCSSKEAAPSLTGFRPVLKSSTTPVEPPEPDSLQLSKPKSVAVPSFQDAIELDELKSEATSKQAAPQKKEPRKSDAAVASKEVTPTVRPLPQIKSGSWFDESKPTASNTRQKRKWQSLKLQAATIGAVLIAAFGMWQYGSGRFGNNPNRPKPESTSTTTAQTTTTNDSADKPEPETSVQPKPVETAQTNRNTAPTVKPLPPPITASSTDTTKTPVETPAANTPLKPASTGPSKTLLAVRDGVYAVFAKHPDGHHFRLGTAWVASRRQLVTSGAVAVAVEELQSEGLSIVVVQPSREKPIAIKGTRYHAAYKQAVERANVARQQIAAAAANPDIKNLDPEAIPPEEELKRALSNQARFDLGVLDIATGERVTNQLKMEAGNLPNVAAAEYTVVGFPFEEEQYRTESSAISEDAQERKNPIGAADKSDSTLTLTMSFPDDVSQMNWSGSPVFDQSQRVIGVYSRTTKPNPKDKSVPLRHAVIWLGRLREFAPEFE